MPRRNKRTAQTPRTQYEALSSCKGKRRFPNELASKRAAELKNLEDSSLNLTVYECSNCRGWHLTRSQHTDSYIA